VKASTYNYKGFAHQFHFKDPLLLVMLPAILGDSFIKPQDGIVKKLTKQFRTKQLKLS